MVAIRRITCIQNAIRFSSAPIRHVSGGESICFDELSGRGLKVVKESIIPAHTLQPSS